MTQHPFAGRKGSQIRTHEARRLFVEQVGLCAMCGQSMHPSLKGKKRLDALVVDHIKPHSLRPDLAYEPSNLWAVCKSCHGHCDSIEKAHSPDADRIEVEKRRACWDQW